MYAMYVWLFLAVLFCLYSTLTLFDGDIGSSPSLELTTTNSSLADIGWNNRASSAVVSGGCQWILYSTDFEALGFSSGSSVISPGDYPFNFSSNETTFGLPDNALSAVRCLPPEGTPMIALFEHYYYFGVMQVLDSSSPDLALINFDNTVSSLVITGGVWELYSGVNYTGSNVTLRQGLYPNPGDLAPIENDDLTSLRLIGKKQTWPYWLFKYNILYSLHNGYATVYYGMTYSYALKCIAACTQTDLIQWHSYPLAYPGLCPHKIHWCPSK